jgi:co-chaperonin GroES (HSP10)
MFDKVIMDDKDEIGIDIDNFNMEEELKLFNGCVVNPKYILVRLFISPAKSKSGLYLNNSSDVYNGIKGYIAKLGACCFDGYTNDKWKDWYKVGDWIAFPRHAGIRFTYKNLPVFSIPDDSPMLIIQNPTEVN